jgi:hypothetical protein
VGYVDSFCDTIRTGDTEGSVDVMKTEGCVDGTGK